jgi:uracil-DNA glycosylase
MTIDLLHRHVRQLSECRRCHTAGFPVAGVPVSPVRAEDIPALLSCKARILIVGQAPGRTEASGTQPFIGAAGRTLFNWFASAGIDEADLRSSALISAVTRCYPGPSATGRGDRLPTRVESTLCRPWLEDERKLLRPSLIIPIGQMAIRVMTGRKVLSDLIGTTLVVDGTACIPLPHPSGASSWIYGPGNRDRLSAALKHIGKWWGGHIAGSGTPD